MAIFDKNNCELLSRRELYDGIEEWVNLYHPYAGAGVKVLWDDNTDSIYLMLQTFRTTALVPSLYLLRFDQSLNLLNYAKYIKPDPTSFYFSDMVMDDNFLHLVGLDQKKDGSFVLTHLLVSKSDLSIQQKFDVLVDFPGYAMSSGISNVMPPRVHASYSLFYGGYVFYIAFNILCSGVDCSEDGSDAYRPAILWYLPPTSPSRVMPMASVQLYRWNTTHWNYRSPYSHPNNTWVTDIVEAEGMLYVVGFIGPDPFSLLVPSVLNEGFVMAVEAETPDTPIDPEMLAVQYFFRLASLEGEADTGGQRGMSAVLGAGSYKGYAYITGTAANYYLEYDPLNPSNMTGVTRIQSDIIIFERREPVLTDLRTFSTRVTMTNPSVANFQMTPPDSTASSD